MKYCLTFKLTKHKGARPFTTVVECSENELVGVKEERAMYFEKLYNTPVRCTKAEIIKEKKEEKDEMRN